MQCLPGPWKHGTRFPGVVADRNDQIEGLIAKLFQRFALVGGDVDFQLAHRADRQRMDVTGRFRTRRFRLPLAAREEFPKSLRHLGPAGISRAENQDALHEISLGQQ
jgi:hypothetical protein